MSGLALELELKRVNAQLSRYRLQWVGIWLVAACAGLPLLGEGVQDSWYLGVFIVVVFLAIAVTFYLQAAYSRVARRKAQLLAEVLGGRGRA